MSHLIRVDSDVFGELQERARAFVDTPNDVLRRVFGFNEARKQRRRGRTSRAARGSATHQREYRSPILTALEQAGGSAPARDVLHAIEEAMNGRFTPRDRERTDTGSVVWENRVQWERLVMVKDGLLKDDSPRGVWELTDEGRAEADRV